MQPNHAELTVKVKYLRQLAEEAGLAYATPFSAGLDLRACLDVPEAAVEPGGRLAVPTGVAIEILQPDVAGFVFSRSGLGAKDGMTVAQGVGVIDPDYRGEIVVWLLNTSGEVRRIERGQRIAQLVFLPCFQARILPARDLSETDRGAGGFGHTGHK
ncbi:dUTP diphosphatase [Desulfovibrio aminophilus]|nr:dUTP diphosphatase [Desulfovibrio aminophilus]MCM0754332.1 dUTP diphosphatase [Desulfovibrio aminophilus]